MKPEHGNAEAAVVVALAMGAGMLAQVVARHLRLPGIVILLAAGVALGPDGAGWIVPESLGGGLQLIVGFAVAVILFEGGMPTVVTPLLRRIRVKHRIATVLEAEGVLIDAVGAVLAVVVLQVVLVGPEASSIAAGAGAILGRLAFGLAVGCLAGLLIGLLLRFKKVVPEGLENVFTLSFVLVLFQLSNLWMHESGIMAVTAAGMVVGNMKTRALRELMEFKEQLTVMLIGMLFVLLAADVRVQSILDLGWRGAITVAVLMFVVRPLNVLAGTYGSKMETRDRLFLCWLAPRGVVAAAVASLFAQSLDAEGVPGGDALRALVFLVIASTVLLQGLTGSTVAHLLGVKRPAHHGYAILGANDLGLTFGRLLADAGESVMFIDSNPAACKKAQEEGHKVVFGNVIEERTLQRAQIEDRAATIAVTPNEEVNLMWARSAAANFDVDRIYVACRRDRSTVTPTLIAQADATVLFGSPRDLELWSLRFRRGTATVQQWRTAEQKTPEFQPNLVLPLLVGRKAKVLPYDGVKPVGPKDTLTLALFSDRLEEATEWLESNGFEKTSDTIRT